MVKVGVIGCGGMGRHHAGKLAAMPSVELVSVCDIIEEKARKLAEAVGSEHCTDYRKLLDGVEAVWVCTEPFNRVEIVTAAAGAGKHIFSEKPIALGLPEADEMIRATDQAGVKFMLGYVLRFTQPFKLLHEIFAAGELGELVNCWTRRYMPMDPRKLWYGQQDRSGGVALDFGSHDIDWLMWIGGPVQSVFGRTARIRPGVQADEHCQAMLTFARTGMACCDVTWWETLSESSIGIVGSTGSMSVDRSGAVRKKMVGCEQTVLASGGGMSVDPEGNIGAISVDGKIQAGAQDSESIQEHFIRCVEQDIQPRMTGQDARAVLQTVIAIRESARTGQAVDI